MLARLESKRIINNIKINQIKNCKAWMIKNDATGEVERIFKKIKNW
jgi:hypothetical protein